MGQAKIKREAVEKEVKRMQKFSALLANIDPSHGPVKTEHTKCGGYIAFPVAPVPTDFEAVAAAWRAPCDQPDYSGDAFPPGEAAKLTAKLTPQFFESLCDGCNTGEEVNDILTDLFFDAVGMETGEESDRLYEEARRNREGVGK